MSAFAINFRYTPTSSSISRGVRIDVARQPTTKLVDPKRLDWLAKDSSPPIAKTQDVVPEGLQSRDILSVIQIETERIAAQAAADLQSDTVEGSELPGALIDAVQAFIRRHAPFFVLQDNLEWAAFLTDETSAEVVVHSFPAKRGVTFGFRDCKPYLVWTTSSDGQHTESGVFVSREDYRRLADWLCG